VRKLYYGEVCPTAGGGVCDSSQLLSCQGGLCACTPSTYFFNGTSCRKLDWFLIKDIHVSFDFLLLRECERNQGVWSMLAYFVNFHLDFAYLLKTNRARNDWRP